MISNYFVYKDDKVASNTSHMRQKLADMIEIEANTDQMLSLYPCS